MTRVEHAGARPAASEHVEAIVVGGGFGGAVFAARLAQAGVGVVVLETRPAVGTRLLPPHAGPGGRMALEHRRRALRHPLAGQADQRAGRGWGGGSLVYANVFARPFDPSLSGRWPPRGPTITTTTILDVPDGRTPVWFQVQDGGIPLPLQRLIHASLPLDALEFDDDRGGPWLLTGVKSILRPGPIAWWHGLTRLRWAARPADGGDRAPYSGIVAIDAAAVVQIRGFTPPRRLAAVLGFAAFFARESLAVALRRS